MIRFAEAQLAVPRSSHVSAGEWIRSLMNKLDQHHFWFALVIAGGVLGCLAMRTIQSDAGCMLLGAVVGQYLGKRDTVSGTHRRTRRGPIAEPIDTTGEGFSG